MKYIYIILLFTLPFISLAQTSQEIGEWRSFLPYKVGIDVTQNEDLVMYATENGIVTIDKNDFSLDFLSKINLLSDVGIADIEYDRFNDQLIIVYENSNIDIYKDGLVTNLPTIKNNSSIIGSKRINDIYVHGKNSIFLSTNFGVVELDGETLYFGNTIFINVIVRAMTSIGNTIYAATDDGVYYIDYDENINIADFSKWQEIQHESLPPSISAQHIGVLDSQLYISNGYKLWRGDTAIGFEDISDYIPDLHDVVFISEAEMEIIIGVKPNTPFGKTVIIDKSDGVKIGGGNCTNALTYAIKDGNGRYWYADDYRGLRYTETYNEGCQKIYVEGPLTSGASDLEVKDNVLYIASGGVNENYSPGSNRAGMFMYNDGAWTNFNDSNNKAIRDNDFANIFQVEPHPRENKVYLGSFYNGIIELDLENGEDRYFSTENSGLTHPENENDGERISGLAFDSDNNLWINNIYSPRPLVVFASDGEWYSYDTPGSNGLAKVTVDENNYIWSVIVNASGGVLVYDHNGTLNDPSDDRYRILNKNNSEIQTGLINCITVDRDGDIWVGTNAGPVIFNSSGIFDADNPGSRLKVVVDSIPAYLLVTEDVRAIEADGANRKWIGTNNGIFVMSPSGDEEITHFDVDNSVLFNNKIIDLAFDADAGVMYISTISGVQSIRTETLGSKKRHGNDVYAFPNPVRPEYQDYIYIKGLARDADVKITDINGKLVHETSALGGQARWDGNGKDGNRVATGTYLVFSTGRVNFDTPDAYVTKIMILN